MKKSLNKTKYYIDTKINMIKCATLLKKHKGKWYCYIADHGWDVHGMRNEGFKHHSVHVLLEAFKTSDSYGDDQIVEELKRIIKEEFYHEILKE